MRSNLLAFATGFLSLSLEILGAQAVFLYFPQSSQALAVALASFLTGLALASFCVGKKTESILTNYNNNIAKLLILLTAFVLIYLYNYAVIIDWGLSFQNRILRELFFYILCGSFLFTPALLLGAIFPILVETLNFQKKSQFGFFNMWDLIGAVGGCLAVGFLLVPFMGLKTSFVVIAAMTTVFSIFLRPHWRTITLLLIVWLFHYFIQNNLIRESFFHNVLFQKNSDYGMVTVGYKETHKSIYINFREMCANQNHQSEIDLARVAITSSSKTDLNVLNIGLGCGFTASEIAASSKVKKLTIAEINPVVVEATSKYFKDDNKNVLQNSKVKVVIDEGLAYLRANSKTYDMIIVDIEEPTIVHSSALYTVDGFKQVKEKLNSDGIFGLWTFEQPETAKILWNSLNKVFKHVQIYPISGRLIFYGSDHPINIDIDDDKIRQVQRIKNIKLDLIATIENNPYSRYYKLEKIFLMPDGYKDPFEVK